MNTEINFLEKAPNKYNRYLWFGIIFFLLLFLAVGLLFYQKNLLTTDMETLEDRKTEIELELTEFQKEFSGKRELQELQQEVANLQDNSFPTVALYQEMLGLFEAEQMTGYDFSGGTELIIDATFPSLDDVADYISSLLENTYVTNTELTSVNHLEDTYEATLTITVNQGRFVEELGTDD
ncbi:hypothetical protein [Oceanobacillus halophilus]|uniref:Uncharacterized protein n=1 Tax=Oceanobacillus halophilus TaxID=930130 RepID=A0A494ZUU5_9BACI|nr:hypothetical protein [Oceanobacillus halophilus]RKQ29891.1 hypothetical protein D8M06_16880 [Oceanobacillus halophilus]